MAGIHIHPHDILDEGGKTILNYINKLKDVDTIFPQVNTIFERNPNPIGVLPRNKKNGVVHGNGKLFISLDVEETFSELYQELDSSIINGRDPLLEFKQCSLGTNYKVVPWFNLLNGDFKGNIEEHCVVTYDGEFVQDWICPNSPIISEMWGHVLIQTKKMYGYSMFMIDRIRYPDWSGENVNPKTLFTCFCSHCKKKMIEKGMNIDQLIHSFDKVKEHLQNKQYQKAVQIFKESEQIQEWYTFRQESVTSFLQRLIEHIEQKDKKVDFWLDLWPPSYSWLLGQNYHQLTRCVPILKHFPYHKLGGGADVQGLIDYFARTPEEQESAFQAFLKLFDFPYDISYIDFKLRGFPIKFVRDENDHARRLSHRNTQIYSGIQMWNIDVEDLIYAIQEAKHSKADDLIYYCYGWADDKHFKAVSSVSSSI